MPTLSNTLSSSTGQQYRHNANSSEASDQLATGRRLGLHCTKPDQQARAARRPGTLRRSNGFPSWACRYPATGTDWHDWIGWMLAWPLDSQA
jgi:hypothetical protein